MSEFEDWVDDADTIREPETKHQRFKAVALKWRTTKWCTAQAASEYIEYLTEQGTDDQIAEFLDPIFRRSVAISEASAERRGRRSDVLDATADAAEIPG